MCLCFNRADTRAVQTCRRNLVLTDSLAFAIDFWMLPRYIPVHFGIFSEKRQAIIATGVKIPALGNTLISLMIDIKVYGFDLWLYLNIDHSRL